MVRVGVDLVEVARVEALMTRRGERALARLFTPNEVAYAMSARPPLRFARLAARLAAKEAFIKALERPIPFQHIEVVKVRGKPWLRFHGRDYPLSLSHTEKLALAVVVLDEALMPQIGGCGPGKP